MHALYTVDTLGINPIMQKLSLDGQSINDNDSLLDKHCIHDQATLQLSVKLDGGCGCFFRWVFCCPCMICCPDQVKSRT
jgi:hypothetical protein